MSASYAVRLSADVKVPMRDGIRLSADVYLPDAPGPFPTVLMRTPYDNNSETLVLKARRLASNRLISTARPVRSTTRPAGASRARCGDTRVP